jgi:hypothetical protein
MIINAFKKAFEGCKRTLESVLNSKRFEEEKARAEALSQLDPNSDLGIAHRVGALTMTELFNKSPEGLALKTAKKRPNISQIDPDMFALTRCLGEELIREAGNCLTEEMLEKAEEWRNSPARRQIEISHWLMKELQSKSQGQIGESAGEATFEKLFASRSRRIAEVLDNSPNPVLPTLYGKWDKENNPANCQGKSQMVMAFAQKAGARCLAIHPAIQYQDVANRFIADLIQKIRNDLSERNLFGVDAGVDEGTACSLQECMFDAMDYTFHIGCAIELSNGQWVILDPHGRSWGPFQTLGIFLRFTV